MTAAGVSSLFLQSKAASGVVEWLRGFDARLPAGPLNSEDPHGFAWLLILTTSFTTLCWITVTLLTPAEPEAKLREFYRKVRPAAAGWRRIAALESGGSQQSLGWSALDWVAGCAMIYLALFGTGNVIFGAYAKGLLMLAAAGLCTWFIFWDLGRRGWEGLKE